LSAGREAPAAAAWHALTPAEVASRLGTDLARGLSAATASERLARSGPNRIGERRRKSAWSMLLGQLQDVMVLVLMGAASVSFVFRELADGVAIVVIVVVNALLGCLQEARAERSLEALRALTAPTARVLRDGTTLQVDAAVLVPGDLLLLEAGDRVPADARLVAAMGLAVDEAPLTGESQPVEKSVAPLAAAHLAPGDRRNMVFMGTHLVRGRGRAVVVATGMATEVGRIAGLIGEAGERETPLQRRLDQLGRTLVVACLLVSALVVTLGVLQGEDPYRMFLAGVSLAVAAIPEGLPAIVTIALALGVQRMIRKHAIVRRLPAVETLGCATVICTDKTGTLTQNRMQVRAVWAGGEPRELAAAGQLPAAHRLTLESGVLCSNAHLGNGGEEGTGDPTEVALLAGAAAVGLAPEALRAAWPRLAEVPFDPERRRMVVVCGDGRGGAVVHVKGAVDEVLARCSHVLGTDGRPLPLDAAGRRAVRQAGEAMAARALRVLAVARRPLPAAPAGPGELPDAERVEADLTLCGLCGLIDPPRPEAREAVRRCREAGVRVVMITGDHALTARAVAEEVGLLPPGGRVVTGADLAAWGERELQRQVDGVYVFARTSPADKLRIVRALQARGHVVAMTGDGVNDAPAVREADIGVAMGRTGTDVTKEASAMVLTDDNFATIVAAVEEGRGIYDNIRKFVRYLLACNTGEVLVMLLATVLGLPVPLLPLQMLLVNLVTDGLPALALGLDPPDPQVMRRPPRRPDESVFARGLGRLIVVRGTIIGLGTLAVFVACLRGGGGLVLARTLAMCTLVLGQLLHAFDARSQTEALWEQNLLANPALVAAVCSSLAVLAAVLYVPALRALFHLALPDGADWAVVGLAASAGAVLFGAAKAARGYWRRRFMLLRART
jgi:Ca2+-transporting ATPase